jgi:hypothetical protein
VERPSNREQALEQAKALARRSGIGRPKAAAAQILAFPDESQVHPKIHPNRVFGDFQREKAEDLKFKKCLCCSDLLLVPVERIELPTFGLQNRGCAAGGMGRHPKFVEMQKPGFWPGDLQLSKSE